MTTRRPPDWQTPDQRKIQEQIWRENDAAKRTLCNFLRFWVFCKAPQCQRKRACCGDPHKCFGVFWPQVPEDIKDEVRALIMEAAGKHEEAQRYRTRAMPPAEAANGAPAAPQETPAPPMPRIRML